MTGWYAEQTPGRSARTMVTMTLLALLLVAVVPVALLATVVLMLLGYVVAGLAVFGGSVLAAAITVALAGMSGRRYLRQLFSGGGFRIVRLNSSEYSDVAQPEDSNFDNLVKLDPSEYTELG